MANYQNLKAAISAAIRTNGNQEITGQVLQNVLNSIVSVIGANYTFAGVATPATNPGTPDQNVFYIATQGGTYTNFGATALPEGISLLMWNGSWTAKTIMYNDGGVFDISVYKSTGGTLAKFADLGAALGTNGANIPAAVRKGGMSVKFVQSSDNKYVYYMLNAQNWSLNPKYWDKYVVDDKISLNDDNTISGHYRNHGGPIIEHSNYFYSEPIYVVKGSEFNAYSISEYGATSNIAMLSWVTKNNDFISKILNPSAAGTYNYIFETDGYVSISSYNGDKGHFSIQKPIKESIELLEEEVSDLQEKTGSILNNKIITNSDNTISNHYRIHAGIIAELNGWFYSEPILVGKGSKFKADNVGSYSAQSQVAMLSWVTVDNAFVSLILNPNGAGTYEYTFDKGGYVSISGYGADISKFSITNNMVETLDESVEKLNKQVSDNTSKLAKVATFSPTDKLVELSVNPLKNIRYDCGLFAIFNKIGIIGDSLASGEMQGWDVNGNMVYSDMYEYSWGQQLAKMTGVDIYNFSQGGQYAKGWMNGNTARTWDAGDAAGGAHSNKRQCYFIGLAHNDKGKVEDHTYTAGIGTVADINDSDYTQNADSYVGWYARIIQAIKSIEPRAYIFCITPAYWDFAAYSAQIRNIVEHFSGNRVYLIDLETYGIFSPASWAQMGNHMSAAGYLFWAYQIANYVDWIIRNNGDDFKHTSLVGTEILDSNPL